MSVSVRWKKMIVDDNDNKLIGSTPPMVPSLAVGGYASLWAVKGMFLGWRLTQQMMQKGITMMKARNGADIRVRMVQVEDKEFPVVQRDGASCACMLLTCTGIFYIEAGTLRVLKAKPWGTRTTLLDYQTNAMATWRCEQEKWLYNNAMRKSTNGMEIGERKDEWCTELGNWLLHMILSDIWTIVHNKKQLLCMSFLETSLDLLSTINATAGQGSSIEHLQSWISRMNAGSSNKNALLEWFKCIRDNAPDQDKVFAISRMEEIRRERGALTIGCTRWDIHDNTDAIDSTFKICCRLHPEIKPVHLWASASTWGHIGSICYFYDEQPENSYAK